ncbi:hypothetical protein AB0D33_36135 [Streptomyces sp. NPDC048404]|uniref:hypothetical protein n=1 Tax=unclassified Streptomyces TaxID=2593676 RepID=UPI00344A7867
MTKGYDFSGSHNFYRDLEPRSGGGSGTTISIFFHKGKTTTSTVGGAVSGEAKVVFVKASASFDYHFAWQWTNSSTYTWSWKVPNNMKHGYLHAGVKAKYTKWNYNLTQPNCTTPRCCAVDQRGWSARVANPGTERADAQRIFGRTAGRRHPGRRVWGRGKSGSCGQPVEVSAGV